MNKKYHKHITKTGDGRLQCVCGKKIIDCGRQQSYEIDMQQHKDCGKLPCRNPVCSNLLEKRHFIFCNKCSDKIPEQEIDKLMIAEMYINELLKVFYA